MNKTTPKTLRSKKVAFTLAEVLITLGVIGIVASMTIPNLVSDYQETQYVTGLKKAYSELSNVLTKISADKGCVGDLRCTGIFGGGTNHQTLGTELSSYFKIIKNCETTKSGCVPTKAWTTYNGSGAPVNHLDALDHYRFITADGMSFRIYNYANNCGYDAFSNHYTNGAYLLCGEIWVDVNGLKGPNYYGRDIFTFWISNGKGPGLYPWGGLDCVESNTTGNWWKNPTSKVPRFCDPSVADKSGFKCGARIIEDGWQMNY